MEGTMIRAVAGRSPMSGAQVIGIMVVIVCATAVLPPAAAWSLNRSRITQTEERARVAVDRLRAESSLNAGLPVGIGVVCGPGRIPDATLSTASGRRGLSSPAHGAWLGEARIAPEMFGAGMPTDAWGRCFLMNAGAWTGDGPLWLLSAGPNGVVETPQNALALGGDDIGGRLK